MEQEKLDRLANILIESEFTCMPRGTFNTKEIYEVVKKNYPEFCNDDFLCIDHCKGGGNQPEWQHRVRGVLHNLKNKSDRVRKSGNHGEWDFI